jgi:hemophore-related protein
MQIQSFNMRRGLVACVGGALVGLVAATIAVPTATAEPQCTAAGLSNAIGTVATATGDYLARNPDANQAVTNAGALPPGDAENAIRGYFATRPQQWAELQRIARPLANLRRACSVQVAPADIARLFDAMAA